ncbi:MAG TPA: ParA family protein [Hyphomicrobiaceae bacterium]|nr:ParA family protein [Hyphomicrobiaceae bacterium]
MTKFIAVSNRRGGVGKTTLTMMLAYGLSVARRQKVLLIDLDAQASTSIVMMGHQRWRAAREANRTASGLLSQIANADAISSTDFIARGIGDVLLQDGSQPALDIIPSSHDLDDKETLMMIAQQARLHNICNVFDHMQERMGQIIRSGAGPYDQVVIDCAPGLSQLVWGALRAADLVLIPYIPDRTAEDNVGWLSQRLKEMGRVQSSTVPNRVSGQDSRAQGIISAISARYAPLGLQIPATQPLATALDHRAQPGTLSSKFGTAVQHVNALADAVLNLTSQPVVVAAE